MLNVVMTVGVLVILTFFSFYVPISSGTRLSLSLSVIITVSVYQLQASSLIPNGTDEVPCIVVYPYTVGQKGPKPELIKIFLKLLVKLVIWTS